MKKLILSLVLLTSISSSACWYSKSCYTDYIYSINDYVVHQDTKVGEDTQYTIQNNIVVDLPITVSVKLVSDQTIDIGHQRTSYAGEILRSSLQYRVLPNGNWITVCNYNTPLGKIDKDAPAKTYFGVNNIWPKNLKPGDVIMIRLYATDGMWQSGDLQDNIKDKLTTIYTKFGSRIGLPNTFSYVMNGSELLIYDLGGGWLPHLSVTVVYSGKERPLR